MEHFCIGSATVARDNELHYNKVRCYIFQHSFDSWLPASIIKTHSWAFYHLFGRQGVILGRIVSEGQMTCGSCRRIIQNGIVLAQESVVNF